MLNKDIDVGEHERESIRNLS